MRHNTDRIRVSHAGNLPRPADVNDLLAQGPAGRQAFEARLPSAVKEIVDRQVALGIDIPNDGEYVKAGSYTGYMQERVSGWESLPIDPTKPPKRAGRRRARPTRLPGLLRLRAVAVGFGRTDSAGLLPAGRAAPPDDRSACAPARSPTRPRRSRQSTWKTLQGRAAGQGRRGLRRRARPAQPGRRRRATSTTRTKRRT